MSVEEVFEDEKPASRDKVDNRALAEKWQNNGACGDREVYSSSDNERANLARQFVVADINTTLPDGASSTVMIWLSLVKRMAKTGAKGIKYKLANTTQL